MTRSQQLAEAYLLVARCNHYMVGIQGYFTADELDEAEQILIEQERWAITGSRQAKELGLALDLMGDRSRYPKAA
jgi:hypothetical protein